MTIRNLHVRGRADKGAGGSRTDISISRIKETAESNAVMCRGADIRGKLS